MVVVDHEAHAWFLLRDARGLVLDVNCSHSAASFSRVLRLLPHEMAEIESHGHSGVDGLARAIQDSPVKYSARCGDPDLEAASLTAIRGWLARQAAP